MLSIMEIKLISLVSAVRHGNGVSARANREAVRKNPDTKELNYIQNKGSGQMENATFMKVQDVADELGVSKSYAYKIVQRLNAELKEQGFLTISGRVNKQYFLERTC